MGNKPKKSAMTRSNALDRWLQTKLVPFMGKVGNQSHLSAIRDGFAMIVPLIIASAVGIIIRTIIFGGAGNGSSSLLGLFQVWSGGEISPANAPTGALVPPSNAPSQFSGEVFAKISYIFNFIFYALETSGIGNISIFFAFSFGYFLARARKEEQPVMGGLISLATFFLVTTSANTGFNGGNGILTAIIFGIASVELYCWFSRNKKLKLTMPEGVPVAVARAFDKLFSVILTLLGIIVIYAIVAVPTYFAGATIPIVSANASGALVTTHVVPVNGFWAPADLVFAGLQAPLVSIATIEGANLGIAVFYTFIVGLLWFFGIHGTNVANGVFNALWLILLDQNINGAQHIFVQGTFDAYIFLGGTEATLGLIVAVMLFSKREDEKAIIRFATPAGIFQINEPIVFGLPLVANITYVVPTILSMPILTVTTWVGYKIFKTAVVTVFIPWVAPVGIGALLATSFDYSSFLIAIINLLITSLIWVPFVIVNTRLYLKMHKSEVAETKKVTVTDRQVMTYSKFNINKFLLLIIPTFFLGFFIISIGWTFGDEVAGQVMATIEGVVIILAGMLVFWFHNIKVWFNNKIYRRTAA